MWRFRKGYDFAIAVAGNAPVAGVSARRNARWLLEADRAAAP
jgi:hypothetical protein